MKKLASARLGGHSGIWVVAETEGASLHTVTRQLFGKALELSKEAGCGVSLVAFGNFSGDYSFLSGYCEAEKIIIADDSRLAFFHDEAEAFMLESLIRRHKPEIVLCGATSRGRALMPRTAVLCHAGLTADCTALEIDPADGSLLQTRPAFGGNILATIRTDMRYMPQMATVRPGVFSKYAADKIPRSSGDASGKKKEPELIFENFSNVEDTLFKTILSFSKGTDTSAHDLSNSAFVIAGGRGMGEQGGFRLLHEFASLTGGAVGASRVAVDAGFAPSACQVGQTGQTVEAEVYLACGISGQIQHLAGMQSSKFIIAVNRDRNAPIMQIADVAVEGDAVEILGNMIKLIKYRSIKNKSDPGWVS